MYVLDTLEGVGGGRGTGLWHPEECEAIYVGGRGITELCCQGLRITELCITHFPNLPAPLLMGTPY